MAHNDIPRAVIPATDEDGNYDFPAPVTLQDVWDIAMIRESALWIPLPEPAEDRLLVNIGPGTKHMRGWEELDYPAWDAETMHLPYSDSVVDAIFTAHTLDHISPEANIFLLGEAARVLRPGATMTIVVPHFAGQLALECIEHKSRFGLKTWRNILNKNERLTVGDDDTELPLAVGFNRIMANEEANLVLVTQLVRTNN